MNGKINKIFACMLTLLGTACASQGQVVINEIVAANSDRLLQYTTDYPRLGITVPWFTSAYDDSLWKSGNGPFGFGSFSGVTLGVNTSSAMLNKYPALYVRKAFNVTAAQAASTNQVQLVTRFNDGFIAFLNGVEIARRNMGNTNMFAYRDQTAFNTNALPCSAVTIDLGSATNRLCVGTNTLCIQTHNQLVSSGNLLCMADLRLAGATSASLVTNNTAWRYFVGMAEPSGGVVDYGILGGVPDTATWATLGFSDSSWPSANGPFGMEGGSSSDYALGVNLYSQIFGKACSLYTRTAFSATAAEAASTQPLQLTIDYDDGIVVFINGREVARRNLGVTNTVTSYDTLATSNHNASGDSGGTVGTNVVETITLLAASNLLAKGDNILSVQLHNRSLSDDDMVARVTLSTTGSGARTLVSPTAEGRYFVGVCEPTDSSSDDDSDSDSDADADTDAPDSESDWVELYNTGTAPVSLTGWSLTDDGDKPRKWYFPAGTMIASNGYLIVMCTGYDVSPANGATYIHTNFKLSSGGEYLGLVDTDGSVVSEIAPGFPAQSCFHSYARGTNGVFAFCESATPGAANTGKTYSAICSPPSFSSPGGFYSSSFQLQLAATNDGQYVRYTLDGSEPCDTNALYTAALTINTNTAVRARCFKTNAIPSAVVSCTYLVAQSAARRSIAAICFTADPVHGLYGPNAGGGPTNGDGIMSIKGGGYTNGLWDSFGDMSAFNMPSIYGRAAERPAAFEYYPTNGSPLRTTLGLRISSSSYSRPRLVLTDKVSSRFTYSNPTQKPSFNIFFRGELGDSPQDYNFFPDGKVTLFENIRLRAGKNDIQNPFIADEFMRRLFIGTGQQGAIGTFASIYINGVWKGYFNPCEHLREGFMQQHHNSSASWDVQQVNAFASGDAVNWNASIAFIRTNDLKVASNYVRALSYFDTTNVADYLAVNTFAAQGDWPNNNWVAARERSDNGRWRFYMWDAEMSFSLSTGRALNYNSFTGDLIRADAKTTTSAYIPAVFTLFYAAPEFRLLFADRVQKHFFNDGCMTRTNMLSVFYHLRDIANPIIKETTGSYITETAYNNWIVADTRRTNYFAQLSQLGLWPTNQPPVFSQYSGTIPANTAVSMTNLNANGTIYFSTNGLDPRAVGGAAVGTVYSAPICFPATATLKARVLGASGEWSPLQEANYLVPVDTPVFLPTGNADWTANANWNSAPLAYPNGTNVSVAINAPVGADRDVSLRAPVTVGSVTFVQNDSAFMCRIRDRSSGNSLTFQTTNGPAAVIVNGTGTGYVEFNVAADTILSTNLRVVVNNTAGNSDYGALRLRANWRGPGGLIKEGDGVATLTGDSKSYTGATVINGGVLAVTESASPYQSPVSVLAGGQLRLTSAGTFDSPRVYAFGGPLQLASFGRGGSLPSGGQGLSGGLRYVPDTDGSKAVVTNAVAFVGVSAVHVESAENALELSGPLSGGCGFVKTGGGNLILSAQSKSYLAPVTVSNGTLTVDGRVLSPVSVAPGGVLSGKGRTGPLVGGGCVCVDGTVLTASTAAGMSYGFSVSKTGSPLYGSPAACGNGVLRVCSIGDSAAASEIDVYLDVAAIAIGDCFRGGVFAEGGRGLASMVRGATVRFFVPDAAGSQTFAGRAYSEYAGSLSLSLTSLPEDADFGDGPRTGEVLEVRVAGGPVSYAEWAGANFSQATGDNELLLAPPLADPYRTGLCNLMRYALGLAGDEDATSNRLPHLSVESNRAVYSFPYDPGKIDLTYRVEASSNLCDWTRVLFDSDARDFSGWNGETMTLYDDSAEPSAATKQFYRLRVFLNGE